MLSASVRCHVTVNTAVAIIAVASVVHVCVVALCTTLSAAFGIHCVAVSKAAHRLKHEPSNRSAASILLHIANFAVSMTLILLFHQCSGQAKGRMR